MSANGVNASAAPLQEVLLGARGLSAGYGTVPAIHDVAFEVRPGELVALMGPNGAGKSTAMLALIGECTVFSGDVIWKGKVQRKPLHRRARQGLAYVERSVCPGMSARDNLRLGLGPIDKAIAYFPEIEGFLRRKAGLLSGGEQQMLLLARALAAEPSVLLVDEVSLGLAPLLTERLMSVLKEATKEGLGVLMVEQQVRRALSVADRAYVFRRGSIVLEATNDDLLHRRDEIERQFLEIVSLEHASPTPGSAS